MLHQVLQPFRRRHRFDIHGVSLAAALATLLAVAPASPPLPAAAAAPPPFEAWKAALIDEAVREGFERQLVTGALAGLQPSRPVIEADQAQAAGAVDLDAYLAVRLTPDAIGRGRDAMRTHRDLLARIERAFGVPGDVVVAIWGSESSYGRHSGSSPVFEALATLAWEPRRSAYFRRELFAALRMVADGHADRRAMLGSWAGAIGQPQFMPSTYLRYAVDFDHDGRRDIWSSEADTLASIANYLQAFGWRPGEPWGREVRLPATLRARPESVGAPRTTGCGAIRRMSERRALAAWNRLGVVALDGSALPDAAIDTSLLTLDDRAFLVHPNYESILGYNCASSYALSVTLLADRIG